jgi:hypothetical protein
MASEHIKLNVDVSEPDETQGKKVLFKRGFVNSLQADATRHQLANAKQQAKLHANSTTFIFDLNLDEHKDVFTWADGELKLKSSDLIVTRIEEFRKILPVEQVPDILVQLSGTPFYAPVNKDYNLGECNVENFYPLPDASCISSVQHAIADLIVDATRRLGQGQIFWIGTQEPTHTTGFSKHDVPLPEHPEVNCWANACNPKKGPVTQAVGKAGREINVRRFINYWKEIVLRSKATFPDAKFGGIQLNSHDADIYVFAAKEIVSQGCPIDIFTVQRYSSYEVIQENLYKVYQFFQGSPGFEHVLVSYDRYSFNNDRSVEGRQYWLTTAGMSSFLRDENQIMNRAEIMHSWNYQITGLDWSHEGKSSLLPQVFEWIQQAPKLKRSVSFSSTVPGLEAFALAEEGRAAVAVWNLGETLQQVRVILQGGGDVLTGSPHVLKGAADTIDPNFGASAVLRKDGHNMVVSHDGADFGLEPNDFVLISV